MSRAGWAAVWAALTLALPVSVHAETLTQALVEAYHSNPVLAGRRAEQAVLDETYVQARAGWRLRADLSAGTSYQRTDLGRAGAGQSVTTPDGRIASGVDRIETNVGAAQLTLSQPLYTGGRVARAVEAAEARVLAGRQGLRGVEAQVLQSVVQAYADVLRDGEALRIRREDVETLRRQTAEAQAKYTAGQVTRTDVAQAQAQLEAANAALAAAQAQVEVSRAAYVTAVGRPPEALAPVAGLPGVPAGVDEAFTVSEAESPQLSQSRLVERASRSRIAELRAAYRPSVALQGTLGYTGPVAPFSTRDYDRALTGGVVFSQPLLTGGLRDSAVRQATAENAADRIAVETARRAVVEAVARAWSQLLGARSQLASNAAQVKAAEVALAGVQAEYALALRTTFDVLVANQNLRSAQLALAQSRRDAVLAQAAVLAAMGRLQLATLAPEAADFDPARNFDRVRRKGTLPWEPALAAIDRAGLALAASAP